MTLYRTMGLAEFRKLSAGAPIKGGTYLSYIRKGYRTGGSGVFFAEAPDRDSAVADSLCKFRSLYGDHSVLVEFTVDKDRMTETWGEYYHGFSLTGHKEREWCIPEYDRTVVVPVAYTVDFSWDETSVPVWYPFN